MSIQCILAQSKRRSAALQSRPKAGSRQAAAALRQAAAPAAGRRRQRGGSAAAGRDQVNVSSLSILVKDNEASFSPGTHSFTPKLWVGFLIISKI